MRRKNVFILFLIAFLFIPLLSVVAYEYVPMEEIPGFGRPGDFPGYVMAIYKFGLWTVGIAAVLMISIGGYMYLTSAGNTSQTGKAKGIIVDAIAGVILAFASWILLYTINPELVKIQPAAPTSSTGGTGGTGGTSGTGAVSCIPVTSGPCSVASLRNTCFGANAEKAAAICKAESNGNSSIASGVDKCLPGGQPVSYGLFQINISANRVGGLNCPSAFSSMYTGSNKNCTVINEALYQQCVVAAKDPALNIQAACGLSGNGINFSSAWKNTSQKCGL